MIVVQTFNRAGWPPDSTIELEDGTGAGILTAARDFEAETGIDLKGDLVAVPAGGLRPEPWIVEMQWAFDHRHDTGANKAKSLALYAHYNMDTASNARPVLTSPHRDGFCADIADSRFLAWLIVNGTRYGLRRTLVKENDLRHFQFFPALVTAALDVTSLDNSEPIKKELPMSDTAYFQMVDADGKDVADWSRIGPDVLPTGNLPGGYEPTADANVARVWGRQYGGADQAPIKLNRADYLAQQQFGVKEYAAHRAEELARLKAAIGTPAGAAPTAESIADAVVKAEGKALSNG